MSNERLRQALHNAAMQPEDFADLLDVDAKTARRWLSGGTPTSRHRARAIEILSQRIDITEHDLWPETAAPPVGDDSRDLIAIYNRSDDIRIPDWRTLLQATRTAVDLLGTALTNILTTTGTTDLLLEKARRGARVRILTAHPESITLALLADQLGAAERDDHDQTQTDRDLALSRSYLERLHAQPEIELLAHWAEPGPTILRFDDEMLVSLHLHGQRGPEQPLMHLRRRHDGGLFDQHIAHLDAVAAHVELIGKGILGDENASPS